MPTLPATWQPFRLMEALNHHLRPDPVAVLAVAEVAGDWHARFSAVERRYAYRILNRRAPAVLDRGRVACAAWAGRGGDGRGGADAGGAARLHHLPLDHVPGEEPGEDARRGARRALRHRGRPRDPLHVRARSFLHNQVRSFAGTLERVGAGAWPPARVAEALAARDRAACGPVAPPQGLFLMAVGYPEDPFA